MNKAICMFVLISLFLPLPSYAAVIKDLDPVEREFLTRPKSPDENQRLNEDFQKQASKPEQPKIEKKTSGSSWWKWTLGLVIVGAVAASQSGKGDSNGSTSSSGGATVTGSW